MKIIVNEEVTELSVSTSVEVVQVLVNSEEETFNVVIKEASEILAEKYALESYESYILSLEQAILSSAARDGAEAERIVCEDIRDELEPYLREIRFDYVLATSYYGKAIKGSLETAPVWTITKIIDSDGVPITTVAVNVPWSDRLTVIYI